MPKKKWMALFAVNLTVIGMAFCGLLHMHYATDTYQNSYVSNAVWQLAVGRYSIYFLAQLFEKAGISLVAFQRQFMLLAIVILAFGSVLLFKLVHSSERLTVKTAAFDAAVILCFVNVFSTELYLFPEYAIYYALGTTIAVVAVCMVFQDKKLYLAAAFGLMVLSLGFYQTNISIFLIGVTGIAWIKREAFLKRFSSALVIGGAASIFNILLQAFLVRTGLAEKTSRDAKISLETISSNIETILFDKGQGQKRIIWDGADLLPQGVLAGFLLLVFLILLYSLVKQGKKAGHLAAAVLLAVFMYVCAYAPHLIAGSVWLSPRSITAVFFFAAVLALMALSASDGLWFPSRVLSFAVIAFLALNNWAVQGIIVNHFATNKIDQNYARDIYKQIEAYEQENGISVTRIAPVNDAIPLWKNHFVEYYSFNINERSFINDWSDVALINFVSGRYFEKVPMDEAVYQAHFQNRDWDYYDPEQQLVFSGDTLYWCKY